MTHPSVGVAEVLEQALQFKLLHPWLGSSHHLQVGSTAHLVHIAEHCDLLWGLDHTATHRIIQMSQLKEDQTWPIAYVECVYRIICLECMSMLHLMEDAYATCLIKHMTYCTLQHRAVIP